MNAVLRGDHDGAADPREVGGEALRDPIDESLLLRVVSEIGEGEDHHREARRPLPIRLGAGRRGRRAFRARPDRIDPHRPRDVLEVLVAEIDEIRIDLAAHVVIGRARDQNAARLANPLQPRRDVDAVAENALALD